MSVRLLDASARQGATWVSRSFTMFLRHPFAFASLLLAFLLGATVLLAVPYVGALVVLAALPLLTLGYMIATRSAQASGPVHVGQLIEPFWHGGDAARRRTLLAMCVIYAAATATLMLVSDQLDGGAFERLQVLLAGSRNDAINKEIDALLLDPRLARGMLLRFSGSAALAVPFWHAPALIWWHGQSVAQSLFSSTLACWRNKAAFLVYASAWIVTVALFSLVAGVLFSIVGAPQYIGLAAVPAMLMFSTAFYVSLYFTFADCFASSDDDLQPAVRSA
jgi:hypothetical protein